MKSMKDRKMDARPGMPKSDAFFPETAHVKTMDRAGDMKMMKYPDTEESIYADQQQGVRSVNSASPKPGYRH